MIKDWKEIHPNFTLELQKDWEEKGFDYYTTKEWIERGLDVGDAEFAYYLEDKGYTAESYTKKWFNKGLYWFDNNYPKEKRSEIREIYLNEQNLEGELDLEDFTYNRWPWIRIYISPQVDETKLKIKNWPNYCEVIEYENVQEYINQQYPTKEEKEEIKELDIEYEKLEGELDLSDFINLKMLHCSSNKLTSLNLSNCFQLEEINCFDNSLTNLVLPTNSANLKLLDLSDNNFGYSLSNQNNSQTNFPLQDLSFLTEVTNLEFLWLGNNKFTGSLDYLSKMEQLKILGINDTDINEVDMDKLPNSLEKIKYSTTKRSESKIKEIKELLDFLFTKKEEWKKKGFAIKEAQEWVSAGAKADDYEFVNWFKSTKSLSPEWITNYKEDYQALSERFKKYGSCSECEQLNTGEQWCKPCNIPHLQKEFTKWSSGNKQINEFIRKHQLEATEASKLLEWVPYKQFEDIEYLAKGGFSKVYKAKWMAGNIHHWSSSKNGWIRYKDENENGEDSNKKYLNYRTVVLKILGQYQENADHLQEAVNHKIIDDWFNSIVPCYGVSQEPQTGEYLMVMKYIEGGDLRKYLKDKQLNFSDKLKRLTGIIQGLKDVHQKKLVHRDFHSGNILNSEIQSFITDLGLCKPADEVNKEDEIYGVLPYVAPEVLRKKGYTPASDIYSLGIVTYEIFADASPYLDKEYDTLLAVEICQGLRPDLEKVKVPQPLKELIRQCWNTDPTKRPTANELERNLRNWQQDVEFINQLRKIEAEYNQMSQSTTYKSHPTAIMTSKRIDTKQITQLLESSEKIMVDSSQEQILLESEEIAPIELQSQIQQPPKQ